MNYFEYCFTVTPLQPAVDILMAELDKAGFEGFMEIEDGLKAYIQKKDWKNNILSEVPSLKNPGFHIEYDYREVVAENWNTEWEKNFDSVVIEEMCTIRAPFHPEADTRFDIVINPKMSFGTGHHETTRMMVRFLLKEEVKDKRVLDMGSGTGVLAILAEKKGAAYVEAVDIDPWCCLNALENVKHNHCEKIEVTQGDIWKIRDKKYDVIFANINKNVLLRDMTAYTSSLNNKGTLIMSGFYKEDLFSIGNKCEALSLKLMEKKEINGWIAVKYIS